MMKKLFACLLIAALLCTLCACEGGETPKETTAPTAAAERVWPTGLFMLDYVGDETGAYVPEGNEFLDFNNQPTTTLQLLWDNCEMVWCEIGADGVGTFHWTNHEDKPLDFNTGTPGTLRLGDAERPFSFDEETGRFWFLEDGERWYDVMKPCSQAALDLVFAGKGGTVPLAEAEIGDLVCLGTYDTVHDREGTEFLQWRVIDRDGDARLLLCDKLIDSFSYNYNPDKAVLTDVTWETCSLRAFLNDPAGFLSVFTADELAVMQTTHLENKAANAELMQQWGAFEDRGEKKYSDLADQNRPDDPDTDDTVFLLSYQEVLRYFGEPTEPCDDQSEENYPFSAMKVNPAWMVPVTDEATHHPGYYDTETSCGAWLTRTLCNSHTDEDMAVYISSSGQVFDYFTYVPLFIRPAVWVKP